ncbi:MAG TPA: hypothetical protein VFQ83_16220 [Candidatus Udaeobacter sp.]|nr:hypothetical protein [Candidatus Udaeobacter sp.]
MPAADMASGLVPYLAATVLGFEPDAFSKKLAIVRPRFPRHVHRLNVRGMRVGKAQIDLCFERPGDDIDVQTVSLQVNCGSEVSR